MNTTTSIARILLVATFLLAGATSAAAQPGAGTHAAGFDRGFYIAPAVQMTTLGGDFAVLTGIRINWAPMDRLVLGVEGSTLLNGIETAEAGPDGADQLHFFYSGLTAEYGFPVTRRLTLSPRLLLGGGEAHWRGGFWDGAFADFERDPEHTTSFVAEPGATIHLSVLPWMHAGLGASYRYVGGGKSQVLSQADMRGVAGSVSLRFGKL